MAELSQPDGYTDDDLRRMGYIKASELVSDRMYEVIYDRYGQTGWEAVQLAQTLARMAVEERS